MPKKNREEDERPILKAWLRYPISKQEATILHNLLLQGRKPTKKEYKKLKGVLEALILFLVGDYHDLPRSYVKRLLGAPRKTK